MWRPILMGVAGLVLSGCATRGAIRLDCPQFASHAHALKKSQLIKDIQGDVSANDRMPASAPQVSADPLADSLRNGVRAGAAPAALGAGSPPRDVLLLSGGGQWGAFGVGFLTELRAQKPAHFPRARTITGVSTGALQALFLAVGDQAAFDEMGKHYRPERESEVVNRNPKWMAPITGSLAGLKPLRRKLLKALCEGGGPEDECPMITKLARPDAPDVFIGFVDSVDGEFRYVAVKRLAELVASEKLSAREAQQCIAGAAMASVAMPVFFQQVRVGARGEERVYYDGGVRQSVFEVEVARVADDVLQEEMKAWSEERSRWEQQEEERKKAGHTERVFDKPAPTPPTIHVLRNGPTTLSVLRKKEKFGPGADALANAFRAESIVVNQLEVQSIADLRLAHPTGPILLITADGWDGAPLKCEKPDGVMFDPGFMKCLTEFGKARAQRDPPWRKLSTILPGQTAADLRIEK